MSAQTIQYCITSVFLVLGGWCIVAPQSVVDLAVRPAYQTDDPLVLLAIACFGAQALIAAIFAAFSKFTRRTFLIYGLAVLPFFWFDYHFYMVEPIFNELIILDAVGNVAFIILCAMGYRQLSRYPT